MNYYFLTTKNLGKSPIIKPKITTCEYDRPCVCVSPSVLQCLIAISDLENIRVNFKLTNSICPVFKKRKNKFRIYVTDAKPNNCKIFDRYITGEKRFYKPTQFRFVGFVDEFFIHLVSKVNRYVHNVDKYPVGIE